jgi:hypothetical protein
MEIGCFILSTETWNEYNNALVGPDDFNPTGDTNIWPAAFRRSQRRAGRGPSDPQRLNPA